MNILLVFLGFIIAFIIVLYYEYKIKTLRSKLKNKVHFYVARDKDGKLWLYIGKPYRYDYEFRTDLEKGSSIICSYNFKDFGLNEKDYTNLKWEDKPIEVFLNMEK